VAGADYDCIDLFVHRDLIEVGSFEVAKPWRSAFRVAANE
jgi:hypothetical protein